MLPVLRWTAGWRGVPGQVDAKRLATVIMTAIETMSAGARTMAAAIRRSRRPAGRRIKRRQRAGSFGELELGADRLDLVGELGEVVGDDDDAPLFRQVGQAVG